MFRAASSFARKLSFVITVALLGGVLAPVATATSASASAFPRSAGFYYLLDGSNNAVVVGCDGTCPANLVIPSTLDSFPVTTLGTGAFEDLQALTSVTIPASVTNILAGALSGNPISDIHFLGDAPTVDNINAFAYINPGAKAHISATAANFGTGSTWYGLVIDRALPADGNYVCTTGLLREVSDTSAAYSITDGVVSSGSDCAGAVMIPAFITDVALGAFASATELTSFIVDPANENFTSIDGTLFNKDATTLVVYPAGKSATSMTIPSSVTSIGSYAFAFATALTNITIPAGIASIGDGAFGAATALTSITVDPANENFTSIDGTLFNKDATALVVYPAGKSATSITIPSSVTSIGSYAFAYAPALTTITIPASVTSIGSGAFYGARSLHDFVFLGNAPESVGMMAIGGNASGAKVHISATATDFDTESTWYGLVIDRAIGVPADGNYVCTTGLLREVSDTRPTYTITNGVVTASGSCEEAVVIPEGVTSIGISAFQQVPLTSITIPSSVTSIGNFAFYYATALHSVTFNEGSQLTSIGNRAFDNATALTSITIPSSVTSIGFMAFYKASALTAVTIGSSVRSIGFSAFSQTNALTSITIPAGVTSIGDYAFQYATALSSIAVDPDNQSFTSIDGVLFNKNKTSLIQYPAGKSATSFTIPESVTSIGNGAFTRASSLGSIVIPESVTSIGDYSFRSATALTSITIPAGVTSIGEAAFKGTTALTSITIPAGVTSIGDEGFFGATVLEDVYFLGNKPSSFGSDVFDGVANGAKAHISATATGFGTDPTWNGLVIVRATSGPANGNYVCTTGLLREVSDTRPAYTITNGVVSQGGSCDAAVTIPAGVTSIGNNAFKNATSLASVTFAEGSQLTSIGSAAFYGASALTSITIPEGVTSIAGIAFRNATSLASVTFAEGSQLTSIGYSAFQNATALTSITIPASVTTIGGYAFTGGSALTTIMVDSANPSFTSIDGVLFNKNITSLIEYPAGKSATSFTIPASVTNIGDGAFAFATALTTITIPASVTSIGDEVFFCATALKDVYFLGNKPNSFGFDVFIEVASGAKAHISATATGFGTDPTWNGLVIDRAAPTPTPSVTPTPTPTPTPTAKPTVKPIAKPTVKPTPTKKPKTSFVPIFSSGSSSISKSGKMAVQKIVTTSGANATYIVIGAASKSPGVPTRLVKALALARAEKVKAYLIKLGVKKSRITIKIDIVKSGSTPKTQIVTKF